MAGDHTDGVAGKKRQVPVATSVGGRSPKRHPKPTKPPPPPNNTTISSEVVSKTMKRFQWKGRDCKKTERRRQTNR